MVAAFIFGTFNPPTNAHVQMGLAARRVLGKDCNIVYVPTGDGYIKSWKGYGKGNVLPGGTRVELLQDALRPYPEMMVSRVEVDGIVDGKTIHTLEHYRKFMLPGERCVLCLGMDNIAGMDKWYRYEDLLQEYPLLIFRRGSYELPERARKVLDMSCCYAIMNLDGCGEGISSTKVRECYVNKNMEALEGLVPDNVFWYLKENEYAYF